MRTLGGLASLALVAVVAACGGELRSISSQAPERATCEVKPGDLAPRVSEAQAAIAPSVRLHEDANVGCEAVAIGVVEVPYMWSDEGGARERLKARAASVGADAVIEVTRAHESNGEDRLLGTAVRCSAVKEDRPYDVLERIDVATVGGPDAAFARLRARAWELHADLVVDVHLAEDATDRTHVTGTAIKYR